MNAFQNAYHYALDYTFSMSEAHSQDNTLSRDSVYYDVEQALRDWDAFAGPRHTDYNPEHYELTDSQWKDCLYAVCETAEARLWDKLEV